MLRRLLAGGDGRRRVGRRSGRDVDLLAAAGALGLDAGTKVDVSEPPITSRCPPPLRVTIHRDGTEALAISYLCVANRLESVVSLKDGTLVTSADGASEGHFLLGSPQRRARIVKKEPIRMRDAIDPVETVTLSRERPGGRPPPEAE